MRTLRRPLLLTVALACAAASVWSFAGRSSPAQPPAAGGGGAPPTGAAAGAGPTASALVAAGRSLFVDGCSSCHGLDARGVADMGPSLYGAGAQAADFYLSTGRMPLNNPRDEPTRSHPAYTRGEIVALTAYVGSLGGPPIPPVDPAQGSIAAGKHAFTDRCAGCHQELARGGIVVGGIAPPLQQASPRQVAEAIRIGPYLMPRFTTRQIDQPTLNSIARYVEYTKHPDNRGGWAIGNIGPIPEGMVAWLLGLLALLIVSRLIGERTDT